MADQRTGTNFNDSFRPFLQRQRSNSVPCTIGSIDFTAEEGLIIFSAAERATSRRRRPQSVDDSRKVAPSHAWASRSHGLIAKSTLVHGLSENIPFTIAEEPSQALQTPLQSHTPGEEDDYSDYFSPRTTPSRPTADSPRQEKHGNSADTDDWPVQVSAAENTSIDLKAYQATVFTFTQNRLREVVPIMPTRSSQIHQRRRSQMLAKQRNSLAQQPLHLMPARPQLISHFSGWSTTSAEDDQDSDGQLDDTEYTHSPMDSMVYTDGYSPVSDPSPAFPQSLSASTDHFQQIVDKRYSHEPSIKPTDESLLTQARRSHRDTADTLEIQKAFQGWDDVNWAAFSTSLSLASAGTAELKCSPFFSTPSTEEMFGGASPYNYVRHVVV